MATPATPAPHTPTPPASGKAGASAPALPFMERVAQAFAQYEANLKGRASTPIHDIRRRALDRFMQAGLPSTRSEVWRYTNVAPIIEGGAWRLEPERRSSAPGQLPFMRQGLPTRIKANVLCMINGRYESTISTIHSPIHQAELLSTDVCERKNSRTFHHYLGQIAHSEGNPLVDLNTAFFSKGIVIRIPEGKHVELPILIYHLASAAHAEPLANVRILIVCGRNSSVSITQIYDSTGEGASLTNAVTEVVAAEGARITLTKLQDEGEVGTLIDSTFIHQAEGSHVECTTLTTEGRLVRNNIHSDLLGAGAHVGLYGLYLLGHPARHIDNYTSVRHMVPDATSDELYKGVASGPTHGVFNGRIYVAQDAQRTSAMQSNRNLVLDDRARINTKPQLEIFADDVKCTHGATIGQLDEEALFYLRARGLDKAQARRLLLTAFAGQITERIDQAEIRAHAQTRVDAYLAKLS